MKQVPITDQDSSDRQECGDASARMLHSGHHRDIKMHTSLGEGKKGHDATKNVKCFLRIKGISVLPSH